MSADLLLTVTQVCARLPGARGAKRVAPSTVVRWVTIGCPSRTGERIRLRATRAGSRWLINPADLDGFFAALASDPPDASAPPVPSIRATSRRQRDHEATVRNLDRKLAPAGAK